MPEPVTRLTSLNSAMTSTDRASRTTRICAPTSARPVGQCTPVVASSRLRYNDDTASRSLPAKNPSLPTRSSSMLRWNDSSVLVAISGLLNNYTVKTYGAAGHATCSSPPSDTSGRSMSVPFLNTSPARISATR